MSTVDERPQSTGAGRAVTKAAGRHLARKLGWVVLAKAGFWVVVVIALLALVMSAGAIAAKKTPPPATGTVGGPGGSVWDPGNIISDQVFYNDSASPTSPPSRPRSTTSAAPAPGPTCLRLDTYDTGRLPPRPWCTPYPAVAHPGAVRQHPVPTRQACGINPQVAIVIIQKESQGLTRPSPPAALTGFGCPDTGPGGSANCSAGSAGVWAQTLGLFTPSRDSTRTPPRELPGRQTSRSCGTSPKPAAASRTGHRAEPGHRHPVHLHPVPAQRSHPRRLPRRRRRLLLLRQPQLLPHVHRLVRHHRRRQTRTRDTAGAISPVAVTVTGTAVTIPDNDYVTPALRGQTITAPTPGIAKGLAAGFAALGLPYVWGGGGDGAGPNNGCTRGGGDLNSCGTAIGFDCSGLTAYVYVQARIPLTRRELRHPTRRRERPSLGPGPPGDIVGFPGHVAIYLGTINGARYILEASWVGIPVHVVAADPHRLRQPTPPVLGLTPHRPLSHQVPGGTG